MGDDAFRRSGGTPSVSVLCVPSDTSSGPPSYTKATRLNDRHSREQAVDAEMQSMLNQKVSRVTPKVSQNAARAKWVFHVKHDEHGHVSRYKARLVAQGQSQVHGVHYFDSFAITPSAPLRHMFHSPLPALALPTRAGRVVPTHSNQVKIPLTV